MKKIILLCVGLACASQTIEASASRFILATTTALRPLITKRALTTAVAIRSKDFDSSETLSNVFARFTQAHRNLKMKTYAYQQAAKAFRESEQNGSVIPEQKEEVLRLIDQGKQFNNTIHNNLLPKINALSQKISNGDQQAIKELAQTVNDLEQEIDKLKID